MKIIPLFPLEPITAFFKNARKISVKRIGGLLLEGRAKNKTIGEARNTQNRTPHRFTIFDFVNLLINNYERASLSGFIKRCSNN